MRVNVTIRGQNDLITTVQHDNVKSYQPDNNGMLIIRYNRVDGISFGEDRQHGYRRADSIYCNGQWISVNEAINS